MFFFFNDTATTEIYTLSLHDALPICHAPRRRQPEVLEEGTAGVEGRVEADLAEIGGVHVRQEHGRLALDRKSTRLNSSHANISYAVFCLKKKTKINLQQRSLNDNHPG